MEYSQVIVKMDDTHNKILEYEWVGSLFKPILVTDEYELCGLEPVPEFMTKIRYLPERRCYEYVRSDTRLKGLLPFAYKAYYYLHRCFWRFLGLLNRVGIMHTPLGAYPSWKDFFRNAN